jgi:hypothetical protein
MREDPTVGTDDTLELVSNGDNIVTLPNLATGRLADLLAAASGPAQDHELRGELAVRTAFVAASDAWPSTRRRFRRTPAVLAVTTVATMMVATTGLAAASELPGPAGRAVQGILGTVGVTLQAPTPAAPVPTPTATVTAPSSYSQGWSHHVGSVRRGCASGNTPTAGSVETASCTITVPGHAASTTPTAPRPVAQAHASAPVRTRGGSGSTGAGGGTAGGGAAGQHHGGAPGTGSGSSGGTGTPPGGGTTRGGNQGGGGGTCAPTGGGTTTTTDPGTPTTAPGGTTTDPSGTDPTPTDPTPTDPACGGHKGGHHHGGSGGSTGGSGGTTGGTTGSSTS